MNSLHSRLFRPVLALLLLLLPGPVLAQVTAAFFTQDTGSYFPHAFVSLRGTSEAGEQVDEMFGFTVKSLSPAILFGSVDGRVNMEMEPEYIAASDVWFEVKLDDEQLAALRSLQREWGEEDIAYRLNSRNCVHFIAEAMRRSGLKVDEPKNLMKKPKTFTRHIAAMNAGRITPISMTAPEYFDFLEKRDRAWSAAAGK